jgi:imidazolonepropionase-like amidohydrolase
MMVGSMRSCRNARLLTPDSCLLTPVILATLYLAGCAPAGGAHGKAFLGAVLIDGLGGPPLSNSVVVTADGRIQAVGSPSSIPIPAEADKVDGSGKVIVPAPIDVCGADELAGMVRGATAEDVRRRIAELAARKAAVIHLAESAPEIADAALEAARAAAVPVLAHISTQAQVKLLVDRGASGFIGMIRDTEELDPALLARLRALRLTFAPALSGAGAALDRAKRNTRAMSAAGVPMAAASLGGDLQHELELLVEAGLPPLDVVVAATRNGALALHRADTGTIEVGKRAGLLVLSANPGEEIGNLRKVVLRLVDGEWVK